MVKFHNTIFMHNIQMLLIYTFLVFAKK